MTSATITWSAATGSPSYYNLQKSVDLISWFPDPPIKETSTTHQVTDLVPTTQYYFRVRAVYNGANGGDQNGPCLLSNLRQFGDLPVQVDLWVLRV